MKKLIRVVLLTLISTHVWGQTVLTDTYGKGIRLITQDSTFYTKINMRFQTLLDASYDGADDDWSEKIMTRRARLKFEGFAMNPNWMYKVELAVSNRDNGKISSTSNSAANIVLDAVVKHQFAPGWQIWFGQTKLPGNRERVISSQKMQFVDRSRLNSEFNIDRGTGFQLRHEHNIGNSVVRQALSLSMGEGRNTTSSNIGGYEWTGRLEFLPFGEFQSGGDYFGGDLKREKTPKLAIGATYDFNNNTTRENGFRGDFLVDPVDQTTMFIDGMFKYRGISSMFEYAKKFTDKNPLSADANGDPTYYVTGNATNTSLGYLFKNNLEIAGRYTVVHPEGETWSNDYKEYTIGISEYLKGHMLKIQTDFTYVEIEHQDDDMRFRFQVEMGF